MDNTAPPSPPVSAVIAAELCATRERLHAAGADLASAHESAWHDALVPLVDYHMGLAVQQMERSGHPLTEESRAAAYATVYELIHAARESGEVMHALALERNLPPDLTLELIQAAVAQHLHVWLQARQDAQED